MGCSGSEAHTSSVTFQILLDTSSSSQAQPHRLSSRPTQPKCNLMLFIEGTEPPLLPPIHENNPDLSLIFVHVRNPFPSGNPQMLACCTYGHLQNSTHSPREFICEPDLALEAALPPATRKCVPATSCPHIEHTHTQPAASPHSSQPPHPWSFLTISL